MSSELILYRVTSLVDRAFDPLTSGRAARYWYELLTHREGRLGRLDGVKGGNLRFNREATIRGGGTINYTGTPRDWREVRVQVWYGIDGGPSWPMGVYLCEAPEDAYTATAQSTSVQLYDKTVILNDDKISETLTIPAGSNVVQAVTDVILETGELLVSIEDSDEVLRTAKIFPAMTSRLQIVNELLDTIDYTSITVDGAGTYRAQKYRAPRDRTPTWNFANDETSIISPDMNRSTGATFRYNRVIMTARSEGSDQDIIAVAEDPELSLPIEDRPRAITYTEEGVDAATQTILQDKADRKLSSFHDPLKKTNLNHSPIPLNLNDAVTLTHSGRNLTIYGVIQTMDYELTPTALQTTQILEVQ